MSKEIMVRHGGGYQTCPVCGTDYYGAVYSFQFCPACQAKRDAIEQQYWDEKRAGMQSIAEGIIANILNEVNYAIPK